MEIKLYIGLLLFFSFTEMVSQATLLQGKITNQEEVEGIHVLNYSSRTNSVTDAFGNFSIRAKRMDTLVFSSVHYLPKKIEVTDAVVESGILIVTLEKLINQLDEVFLRTRLTGNLEQDSKYIKVKEKVDFWTLGIPGFQGEPEEKIPTVIGQTIGPTHVNIDALYKYISGYYKKLKIQRKWEVQNNTVATILFKYNVDFFLQSYQIPTDAVYDFILFCMETTSLQTDFIRKNYGLVLEVFKNKAPEYRARLAATIEKKE